MSNKLRPIEAAENAAESIKKEATQRIDWLDHYSCDHCNSLCDADRQFVERQATYMPVWVCEECGSRFYREEENTLSFDFWR